MDADFQKKEECKDFKYFSTVTIGASAEHQNHAVLPIKGRANLGEDQRSGVCKHYSVHKPQSRLNDDSAEKQSKK